MTLRYYQQEAYDAALRELEFNRSTMAVLATGLGKSRLFTALAKHWKGRVLILAHRAELVEQAAETVREQTGEQVDIEQGRRRSRDARIVVASTQSITQQYRLDRIGRDGFSLIIPDEVHHYTSKTFKRVLDWFCNAKVFGVTATPDRTDKKALGTIMDSVCYTMDIKDGIHSGYLVPIKIGRVRISGIDLRGVSKVRGDLHEGKLEKVMLENVGAVVQKTLELHPDRQGIFFWPGVESAELAAEKLNSEKPGSAVFVSGKTDKAERAEKIAGFRSGKYQYLSNCQIATEGFDAPTASLVVIARPTMSRSLFTQMVGRGARVIASCVAGIEGKDNAGERRAAIEWSPKADCVILDFVGNSGKHSLISPIDLLGGDYTDEEKEVAKEAAEELADDEVADPEKLLEMARQRLEARKRVLRLAEFHVTAVVDYVDPFSCLGIDAAELEATDLKLGRMPLSVGAKDTLRSFGVDPGRVETMSKTQGEKMLRTLFHRNRHGYCSYSQLQILKKWGIKTSRVFKTQAGDAIKYLVECGYGKRSPVDGAKLTALATGVV